MVPICEIPPSLIESIEVIIMMIVIGEDVSGDATMNHLSSSIQREQGL